ncbi:MAG: NAD(P)/FAD-dependent oxidoreductase [Actinomycetota bacterium]
MTETADVVVIGGGIVGCSAAYHLAAAGAGRVVLVEREAAVGRGATGACAGGFRQQFTSEINIRLSQASVPMILRFEGEHGIPVDVSQDGYLFLVRDPATWSGFERGVELQRSLGVGVEVLDAAAVTRLLPDLMVEDLVGATFGPDDGIADPAGLTQGYATLARRSGAEIRLGRGVDELLSDAERVVGVRTGGDVISAGAVVLAAGPWSGVLAATAGLELPIEPVPRVVLTTSAFPGVPSRRTLVVDAGSSFYFHREGDGVLMGMGGDDAPSFETEVDEGFVTDRLLPRALAVYPPLAEAGIRSRWAGLYEMTPDRHPVIGPGPLLGLWIAAGFSGHGFQHGPVVGRLTAEMITGQEPTVDVSALSFERFERGQLVAEGHVV